MKHGTTDVRGEKIKAGNRERQRRRRDRQRAGCKFTLQEERRILREAENPRLRDNRLHATQRRNAKKAVVMKTLAFHPADEEQEASDEQV